jgi:hypothetical protein
MANRITIEICGKRNQDYIFQPISEKVRGRKDSAYFPQRGRPEGLAELLGVAPVIPGEYIMIDLDKMEGHRLDPLRETETGQQIWEQISPVIRRHSLEFGNVLELRKPSVHKLSLDDGMLVKDWLWAMARAVEGGHARVVSGNLPTLEEISKMPGKRTRDPGNSGAQEEKLQKFVDVVPPRGQKRESQPA